MVTYVDIGLAFDNMFAPNHIVPDKRKHTKHPAPRFHKKECDCNSMWPKECRQNNAWQKQQHKNGKYQKDPDFIEC
jgi:arylamine N-acetyltransferase